MRYEYRIKVEEKNNGQKSYIPQIGEHKLTFCLRSVYPRIDWKNLIGTYKTTSVFSETTFQQVGKEFKLINVLISDTQVSRNYTENVAEDIINFHKKQMEVAKGEEIKNVYFIKK
jgi:hypothetical protein